MIDLGPKFRQPILDFINKYLVQIINTVFGVIEHPKEASDFLYERLYFAYAAEKGVVINNVTQLENYYRNVPQNQYKLKAILKITRPIVKINFLIHGDRQVIEMIKFSSPIDLNNKDIVQEIINFSDKVLSAFVEDLFKFKNESGGTNRDEITMKVAKFLDNLNSYIYK